MKELRQILSRIENASTRAASSGQQAEDPDPEQVIECPICGGAGFVRRERVLDDPLFGRAEPCSCVLGEAADVRRSRLERMREELRYADRYEFQVINDDVERAVAEIGDILRRREAERNA